MQPPQVLDAGPKVAPTPATTPPLAGRRAWLGRAGLALGAAALGGGLASWLWPQRHPDPAVAQLLARTLPDAFGQPVPLARYRNQPLIVNFWATWCPPCLEEMPELSALAPRLAGQGVHVLGLGLDQPEAMAEYARRHSSTYPLLVAGPGAMSWMYELGATQGALPWTVLIDAQGQIAHRIDGRLNMPQLLHLAAALHIQKPSN